MMQTDDTLTQAPTPIAAQTLLTQMQAAHRSAPMPDLQTRLAWLDRLERMITEHESKLVTAMQSDFSHRSFEECRSLDLDTTYAQIRMIKKHLKQWMRTRRVQTPLTFMPARAQLHPQPRGVVGVMSPWNFPVYLSIAPMAAALAAGNRVMLKPSEVTPQTSQVMSDILGKLFTSDEVAVVLGGVEAASEFSALPFDHLLFTGSTGVGRKVAEAAARNLTPVTLELGGKSPAIVMPSADLNRAARRIAWGKTTNAGQVCVAPDYVLVPRDQMDAFTQKAEAMLRKFYPKGAASPDYCAIITDQHKARLEAMLAQISTQEAQPNAARIIQLSDDGVAPNERKFAPAIVIDPPLESTLMQDEIFGPILPIIPYDDVEDALKFVREREHPLAMYVFALDKNEQDLWLDRSLAGGVTLNDTVIHVAVDTLPFGGVGASGYGAYHGKAGFETFSHMKPVLRQAKWNAMAITEAPMTGLKKKLQPLIRKLM